MALEIVPLEPIERGQLYVMRLRAAIWALSRIAVAVLAELILHYAFDNPLDLPWGALGGPMVVWGGWSWFGAARQWRRWGYAFTGAELHVAYGWLTRVHTIVPVSRVQHIDVVQTLFERIFGVSTLWLHTAGTDNSVVILQGITRETAEAIRDAIRERIGGERE